MVHGPSVAVSKGSSAPPPTMVNMAKHLSVLFFVCARLPTTVHLQTSLESIGLVDDTMVLLWSDSFRFGLPLFSMSS